MILISGRKTSPGTSCVGKGVNKVTCSRTRPAGSSRRGPGVAGHAAQGSLAPLRGVPGRGQAPCVCFLRVGDLVGSGLALALFPPPLPSAFLLGHPSHLRALFLLPSPKVASFPSPPSVLRPPSLPCSLRSLTAVPVTHRLFAPAYFTHHPEHGWVGGIARRSPLEATCRGHPRALNSRNPQPRGDSRAH